MDAQRNLEISRAARLLGPFAQNATLFRSQAALDSVAEANVPYDKLYDMEAINSEFVNADVALVIGANDVVNPAARNDNSSPIYGMPILNADQAKAVIVKKLSMNPGFAGIENELFYDEKTSLLFGDAKVSLGKLVTEMKNV